MRHSSIPSRSHACLMCWVGCSCWSVELFWPGGFRGNRPAESCAPQLDTHQTLNECRSPRQEVFFCSLSVCGGNSASWCCRVPMANAPNRNGQLAKETGRHSSTTLSHFALDTIMFAHMSIHVLQLGRWKLQPCGMRLSETRVLYGESASARARLVTQEA